jgi:GMP synthase-like glutamine amidotransferase
MHIHCFQHLPFETPGTILQWIERHNHTITYTNFFEKDYSLPKPGEYDCLLIMGGYMNVDEEEKFPWLKEEKQQIKKSIDAGKKVIGICLGSQLIAAALCKKVYKGKEKEIGFFPVTFSDETLEHSLFNHFSKEYTVFHWHGDTFDLPDNAQPVASTPACANQAFIIGNNVIGLQFHFEMNETVIEEMILHGDDELLEKGNYIQGADEVRKGYHWLQQNRKDIFILLDKFFASGC